jgi:hypothetical protein
MFLLGVKGTKENGVCTSVLPQSGIAVMVVAVVAAVVVVVMVVVVVVVEVVVVKVPEKWERAVLNVVTGMAKSLLVVVVEWGGVEWGVVGERVDTG